YYRISLPVQMPFEWLVQLVPLLKTRAFSRSSSLLAHPNQVRLTAYIFQHGFIKALFLAHHHHLFLLDLELGVHLSLDLWRKEPYRVYMVQLLRLSSSLVVVMKRVTIYTKSCGYIMHRTRGYFHKQRAEGFTLPSQETNHRRCQDGISRDFAAIWLKALNREGKYHVEAWS
ncbi:hypothetical protein Ddye_006183, partial [Dipteronia dyeriana]